MILYIAGELLTALKYNIILLHSKPVQLCKRVTQQIQLLCCKISKSMKAL